MDAHFAEIKWENDGRPKYRQLADRIEDMIRGEQLDADFRIPSERQLAKKLGVSVITVNSAMIELTNRKLVERRIGSGTYVRKRDDGSAGTGKIGFFRHGKKEIRPTDRYMGAMLGSLLSFWQNTSFDFIAMRRDAAEYRKTIETYRLNGILIYSPRREFLPEILALRKTGFPVVAVSSIHPEIADIGFGYSNLRILEDAVHCLAGLGHRDIAFLIPDQPEAAYQLRREGFLRAMWKERIPQNPVWSTPLRDPEPEIRAMFSGPSRPTAVILGSCGYAAQFYRIARELHLTIPGDVSVLSIDEDDSTLAQTPPPSSFRVDVVHLTLEASKALLAMLEHREVVHSEEKNFEFIDRNTCRRIQP